MLLLNNSSLGDIIFTQAKGFMLLATWLTDTGKLPRFRHHVWYDNAPSHHKRASDALDVDDIPQRDGFGKRRRDTTWLGVPQSMVVLDPATGAPTLDAEGNPVNKGLRTVGFERGHWDNEGKVEGRRKPLTLEEIRDVLRKDPDFVRCPTILEQTFADFRATSCTFSISYLAKFWCTLAWIEQYWNDCKQVEIFVLCCFSCLHI